MKVVLHRTLCGTRSQLARGTRVHLDAAAKTYSAIPTTAPVSQRLRSFNTSEVYRRDERSRNSLDSDPLSSRGAISLKHSKESCGTSMPDLSGAPPSLGPSRNTLQSRPGGSGRFHPGGGHANNRGRGGNRGRRDGRNGQPPDQHGKPGGPSNSGPRRDPTVNPQHPGHIPGSKASRPISGVFAIDKPSGVVCMRLLEDLKDLLAFSPLFRNPDGSVPEGHGSKASWRPQGDLKQFSKARTAGPPKIGQGGTLDPLATGVLVIGVGTATRGLQGYLDGAKTYTTTGLLGTSTTSYDSQDPIMKRTPHTHVTKEAIREMLPYFTGPLLQYPPLYSAVRMDGKRLFEYARENIPLPRPIEAREIEILDIDLYEWLPAGSHQYMPPEKELPEEEKALLGRVKQLAGQDEGSTDMVIAKPASSTKVSTEGSSDSSQIEVQDGAQAQAQDQSQPTDPESNVPPAAFSLRLSVSSGTFVRSIVHDVGIAVESAAHVVALRRTRQGKWCTAEEIERLEAEKENAKAVSEVQHSESQVQPEDIGKISQPEANAAAPMPVDIPVQTTTKPEVPQYSESLPVLPWSLFSSALASLKAEGGRMNDLWVDVEEQEQDQEREQEQEPGTEVKVEDKGGKVRKRKMRELREWERKLLEVIDVN